MADKTFEIDPEILIGFLDDSLDDLGALDTLFADWESDPSNLDTINAIFRPIHSIKGNSAFFGLLKVKKLSHEMENLLDMARKELLTPNRAVIDVLLAGVDELREMLRRTREGENELADETRFNALLERVIAAKSCKNETDDLAEELFRKLENLRQQSGTLEAQQLEQLDTILSLASRLARHSTAEEEPDAAVLPETPEALRTIQNIVERPADRAVSENESMAVLNALNELKTLTDHAQALSLIETALDEYHTMVDAVGFDPLLCELLGEKMGQLAGMDVWGRSDGTAENGAAAGSMPTAQAPIGETKNRSGQDAQKTMRVSEESIDTFLGYVGDLIVIGEMYNHLQKELVGIGSAAESAVKFKRINESFGHLSTNLQQSIMEIRKLPMRVILQKVPRTIRDIAAASGKDIRVELAGEEIKVDKRHIEILDAPLTHMIRNAADHGIEPAADRQTAGKAPQGTVRIQVTETTDDIILEIGDDGRGLNYEGIRAKAIQLGLIGPEQELTEDKVTDLLFSSGVSTAREVTDVSGRGVGMDVVKRNIESANGKISITSEAGAGTTFQIRLPKTVSTQIIDGFLVKLGGNCFVFPMERIQEVFCPAPGDISTVAERGLCVMRHGELLSVVRLMNAFDRRSFAGDEQRKEVMVSVETGGSRKVICVDEVLGIQKVVLKELDGLEVDAQWYSAAAVMGDGTIAMVLDIDRLG